MTPFAKQVLLAIIAILVVILLARIVMRWWRDRQALKAAERSSLRSRTAASSLDDATQQAAQELAKPVVEAPSILKSAKETAGDVAEAAKSTTGAALGAAAGVVGAAGSILKSGVDKVEDAASEVLKPVPSQIDYVPSATKSLDGSGLYPQTGTSPLAMHATADELRQMDPEELPFSDTSDYSFGKLTPVLAAMLPESPEKKLELKRALKNAGYFTPHAWQNLAATRYLGIMLPIVLFGVLLVLAPKQFEWPIIGCLVTVPLLGYALPSLLVKSQAANRLRQIEQGMPDMLDMLNMCVSQGMTLPNGLTRVSREIQGVYPALAQELMIVSEQSRIGGLQQSLTNFSNRVDLPDVHSFTSLMVQTDRMGTSISDALSDYSDNMRENLRQRADQKANSASFKLLFPTVLCLMPAVFLFLLGPAIVQLHDFFTNGATDVIREGANAATQTLGR
ncbi:MAG: type II secretion system F family protein [Planctomycetaceae bacterium]